MTWRVFVFALILACRDESDGEGSASEGGGSGTDGGGGCALAGGLPPARSTITGSGFHAWNGETARGCFLAAQSFGSGCDEATVVDGGFSLTTSTCTGVEWRVWVGDDRTCFGLGSIRPERCLCGKRDSNAGAPGSGCDAGAP